MQFIKKEYLEEFKKQSFKRADESKIIHYTQADLFNQAKEVLLRARVSEQTWYLLIKKIQEQSLGSKESFMWTTMPLNITRMIFDYFKDDGVVIDIEDLRNILYAYEDYIPSNLDYACHQHFALQDFVLYLYKIHYSQSLIEILALSDFLILKMCSEDLMSACIPTIETCIKICKQTNDNDGIIMISEYGMSLLNESSTTYKYCENAKKRALKTTKN